MSRTSISTLIAKEEVLKAIATRRPLLHLGGPGSRRPAPIPGAHRFGRQIQRERRVHTGMITRIGRATPTDRRSSLSGAGKPSPVRAEELK